MRGRRRGRSGGSKEDLGDAAEHADVKAGAPPAVVIGDVDPRGGANGVGKRKKGGKSPEKGFKSLGAHVRVDPGSIEEYLFFTLIFSLSKFSPPLALGPVLLQRCPREEKGSWMKEKYQGDFSAWERESGRRQSSLDDIYGGFAGAVGCSLQLCHVRVAA